MNTNAERISSGSPFEKQFAYSRAFVKGNWCFVSGTTGYDYEMMEMPESALDQANNAMETIAASLSQVEFAMTDIVRVQYTIAAREIADEVHPALRKHLSHVLPAATMVVAGLIKPEMKIEVEVTAFRG